MAAHQSQYCLSLFSFLSHKLNSFYLFKALIFIVFIIIYGEFVSFKKGALNVAEAAETAAAASKNSTISLSVFMTPHVVDDNNIVLAINNFNGNFLNRNQIVFDILQPKIHDTNDNDLLSSSATSSSSSSSSSSPSSPSSSIENCTKITNCGSKTCHVNTTTLTIKTNRTNPAKAQLRTVMAATRDMMINTTKIMSISNVSSSLSLSQTNTSPSSSSSSSSSVSSTLLSSSPSSLLLLSHQQKHLLSRPKRYLSFPEGSSFSVAVCFTVGIIGNPRYNYMSFGLNWGVAYDLPNSSWILNHLHGFAKRPIPLAVWHRRSRRALYKEIENVVDNMGYNGRDCVLRALCESRQYFRKTKMSMIGEMLRVIFSLPKQRIFTRELSETSDIALYDRAYRKARSIMDCSEEYNCGFSLLELAFGKYSTPPDGYYTNH